MSARTGAIAAAALAAALGGCTGLTSNAPQPLTYVLAPAPLESPRQVSAVRLQIARPSVRPGLESDRIALIRDGRLLDYYAASRWAGPLPQVVEALAIDTFRAAGALGAVQEEGSPFEPDYVLRISVRHFEALYPDGAASPRARVSLACTLGRRADRAPITSFLAEAAAEADANRLSSIVAAFERAAHDALAFAHERTIEAIAGDTGAR